jgi:membrane associated rhomboid family serine protease
LSKKTIYLIVIIIGAILTLISLIADFIGIGSYPGINSAQLAGIVIGLIIVSIGLILMRAKSKEQG